MNYEFITSAETVISSDIDRMHEAGQGAYVLRLNGINYMFSEFNKGDMLIHPIKIKSVREAPHKFHWHYKIYSGHIRYEHIEYDSSTDICPEDGFYGWKSAEDCETAAILELKDRGLKYAHNQITLFLHKTSY